MAKNILMALLSIFISYISLKKYSPILLIIYVLIILFLRWCTNSDLRCIETAKNGIRGTAKLYSCPSYRTRILGIKHYMPVFMFEYEGKTLYRESLGEYSYETPYQIGEIKEIVYCKETDSIMLINEFYEKCKNANPSALQVKNKDLAIVIIIATVSLGIYFSLLA